jgi:hypothetical protein
VIRIFPARASVIRLLGALLMEQDEQWSTGHRYLDMRVSYCQWRAAQASAAAAQSGQNPDGPQDREAVEKGRRTM